MTGVLRHDEPAVPAGADRPLHGPVARAASRSRRKSMNLAVPHSPSRWRSCGKRRALAGRRAHSRPDSPGGQYSRLRGIRTAAWRSATPRSPRASNFDACRNVMLLAFSCKRRGLCPSCGTRRMAETAAHLFERVLPERPLRQWVLSFPNPLRFLFATRPAVLTLFLGWSCPAFAQNDVTFGLRTSRSAGGRPSGRPAGGRAG